MKNSNCLRVLLFTLLLFSASISNAQTLVGVTGDGASTPETLFTLDPTNGAETFLMTLGNGADGETIACSPADGLLYHSSGISDGDRFWESINLDTTTIVSSGQFTGADVEDENLAMVYNAATGRFLVTNRDEHFFDTTLAGAATTLGFETTPANVKGLAFVGSTLYGAQRSADDLHTLNPADGSSTGSVTVTMSGFNVTGFNGLTTHPDTDALYAIVKTQVDQETPARHLATINPATGVATFIGTLNDSFAGIAYCGAVVAAPPTPVPTLSEWGVIISILLMAGVFLYGIYLRRRGTSLV